MFLDFYRLDPTNQTQIRTYQCTVTYEREERVYEFGQSKGFKKLASMRMEPKVFFPTTFSTMMDDCWIFNILFANKSNPEEIINDGWVGIFHFSFHRQNFRPKKKATGIATNVHRVEA